MARILVIRNWEEFQHYKDRDPPWIKLYRDTLTSEVWVLGTDVSRLVQIASTLLAARYKNKTPLNFELWREVAKIRCTEQQFHEAIAHLCKWKFTRVQDVADEKDEDASNTIATCYGQSRGVYSEQSRAEGEQSRAECMNAREERAGIVPRETPDTPASLSLDFEDFVQVEYPPCTGRRSFTTALRNIATIIGSGRATEAELRERITGYRAFVTTGGVSGPNYVLTPQNWTDPMAEDPAWAKDWAAVPTKTEQRMQDNIDVSQQWLRDQEELDRAAV